MSTRWWAPRRASLVPDAVVLALLEPSGQPAGDLGATVLAAHRAGAAACEYVAKAGLPSEAALITALAGVRATLADPMVTTISKSMDPSYAGLLVRDVFDDAESAAVTLYGAAVAKGVSPPIAAARVGAVFGVPAASMGKYQGMACDPKANPTALVDAADRALMGYVSKLVASESPETISKAITTFADPEFDPTDHPRGTGGRFVSNVEKPSILQPHILAQIRAAGGGGQAAPQVGPKERPVTRKTRATRKTRQTAEQVRPSLQAPPGQLRGQLSPRQTILANAFARMNRPELAKPGKALPNLLTYPDPKAKQNKDAYRDTYYKISHPVVFGVSEMVDNDFQFQLRSQAGEQAHPETAMFRIGHLLREADFPQVEKASQNIEAINQITDLAEKAKAEVDYLEPYVEDIGAHDMLPGLDSMSPQEADEALESLRRSRFTTEKTTRLGRQHIQRNSAEDRFVKIMPKYLPMGVDIDDDDYKTMMLIHFQPADPSRPRDRPIPTVNEYVIEFDAAGKETEEDNKENHLAFELDPNAAYKIVPPPGVIPQTEPGPKTMWDNDRKVVVNRYYLREIDEAEVETTLGPEPFHKADTMLAFQERAHPRDAFGQWINAQMSAARTTELTEPPVPRAAPTRAIRATRKTRATRQVRPVAQVEPVEQAHGSAALSGNLASSMQGQFAASLKGALSGRFAEARKRKGMAVLPPLSDASNYKLLTKAQYEDLAELISKDDFITMSGGGEVKLLPMAARILAAHKDHRVESLSERMRFNVEKALAETKEDINRAPIGEMLHGMLPETNMHSGQPDHEAIADRVGKLFEANDKLDQVEIEIRGKNYYFYGNSHPVDAQILFQVDPDLDYTKPVVMTWRGEHRAHDVRTLIDDQESELVDIGFRRDTEADTHTVASPMLNVFKVTNPVVHRFVVNNA